MTTEIDPQVVAGLVERFNGYAVSMERNRCASCEASELRAVSDALQAMMAEIERLRGLAIFDAELIQAELEQSKAERAKYEAAILAVLHSDDHEHARSIAEAAYHGSEAVRRLQDTQDADRL